MARSGPEVADVFRRYGDAYRAQHGPALSTAQRRVMTAIELCRTAALARQPRMIGNLVAVRQPQEVAQRERVGATPGKAALAVDAFEIADHMHAEVPTRRKRRRAHPRRVVRLADLFDEGVEPGLPQQLLQPIVERVPRRARHLRPCHDQITLSPGLPPHRHRRSPSRIFDDATESGQSDFVNGLLSPIARSGCFLARSNSHSVAVRDGCTKIPLAAGGAHEDETILQSGCSSHPATRFVHLDPPELIWSWEIWEFG
jgi:hypothetical protein